MPRCCRESSTTTGGCGHCPRLGSCCSPPALTKSTCGCGPCSTTARCCVLRSACTTENLDPGMPTTCKPGALHTLTVLCLSLSCAWQPEGEGEFIKATNRPWREKISSSAVCLLSRTASQHPLTAQPSRMRTRRTSTSASGQSHSRRMSSDASKMVGRPIWLVLCCRLQLNHY